MSLLQRLHEVRSRIGRNRQKEFAELLDELDGLLEGLSVSDPYGLDYDQFSAIEKASAFRAHLRGRECEPGSTYLYRICGLGTLINFGRWTSRTKALPRWLLHQQLLEETAGTNWRPLRKHCTGPISGRRGFTWWSTMDLYVSDYCRAASRAGIPLDLLPPFPLILRVRWSDVIEAGRPRVPTVIDGWDMPVFDPMPDPPRPQSGRTISLEELGRLSPGCDEYVVGPLPSHAIQFIAIPEAAEKHCGTKRSTELWERLMEYHA